MTWLYFEQSQKNKIKGKLKSSTETTKKDDLENNFHQYKKTQTKYMTELKLKIYLHQFTIIVDDGRDVNHK